jgi:hypothetical protein
MSDITRPGSARDALIARAKAILLAPAATWPVIEAEPATAGSIYRDYVMILAAIPPLAGLLHGVLFGYGAFGFTYRPSLASAIGTAIVHYGLTLGGVYVLALIVNWLAPSFDGRKDQVQAIKLVAYASTASWLSGAFTLIPGLGILGILGLYSLYLFYLGLPVLMRSPPSKTLPYTALIIVAAIVVGIVIAPLSALLIGTTIGTTIGSGAGPGDITGSLNLPNGGSLQFDTLHQAAGAMQAAGNGHATPRVPVDTLKTFLPATVAGLARTETSSAGGDIAGVGASTAEAKYAGNGSTLTITVADLGSLGALASLGGALSVNADEQTATGFNKVYHEGGRTIAEEYDNSNHSGKYTVIVANRFMVTVEGTALPMGTLKSVAKSIDLAHLGALVP